MHKGITTFALRVAARRGQSQICALQLRLPESHKGAAESQAGGGVRGSVGASWGGCLL